MSVTRDAPEVTVAASSGERRTRRLSASAWPLVLPIALVFVVELLAGLGDTILKQDATYMLIYLIAVLGLYTFTGLSGVLSFGHVAFVAIGCYLTAIITMPVTQKGLLLPSLPHLLHSTTIGTVPAIIIAAAFTGVVGYIMAIPLMRLSGLPAAIATLAVLEISQVVENHWTAVTRGNQTFIGAPIDTTRWGAFAWAAAAITAVYIFQQSRFGVRLKASREDAFAAEAVGINLHGQRRLAFALSAAIAAVAGGLYGHFIGVFSPDSFYLDLTFLFFVMLVVGGIGSLGGAVVGVVIVSALQEVLQRLQNGVTIGSANITLPNGVEDLVLALLLLVIMILRPAGIMGGRELALPSQNRLASIRGNRRRRRTAAK
jgi:branched-chain amino acid transport system permease protein